MALIKCSNCNHEISDTIKKCIHCGAKVQKQVPTVNKMQPTKKEKDIKNIETIKEKKKRNYKSLVIGIISLFFIVGVSILSITTYNWLKDSNYAKSNEDKQTNRNDNKNNNNYSTQNETKKLTLITIDNCIHCDNLKPVVEEISSEYGFNLEIKNYKENELDNKYKEIEFFGYPTLFLFDNENYIAHCEGYKPKEEIIAFLKENDFIKE